MASNSEGESCAAAHNIGEYISKHAAHVSVLLLPNLKADHVPPVALLLIACE